MSILALDGADVWFEQHGAGGDVVISSASGFGPYPAILAEDPYDCTVVTVQARGFGRSTHLARPPAAGWLDQWGADVLAVADHLGIDTFVYTGVSHGAGIGWHLARNHPERLRALVSVVGTPHDRSGDTSSSAGRRRVVEGRRDPAVLREQFGIIGGPTEGEERLGIRERTLARLVEHHLAYTEEEALVNQGMPFPEAADNEELAKILATVEVPVLSLAGLRDGVISPQSALRAATAVRHSKTVLFEDEGHFMAEERPRRLAREVKVFLAELADYETNGGHWR
ncbi:alpha/beta hydrolase [Actinacidiphila sp. DG2A-62]|uniref:alpha/beta fold hydrolase n=1 Tax=Actinacidiphila sp. DG2A-62 TaxID=3108821 RepID=UPI002DB7DA80|nr:alpha/beta hydrolase [Actinacidiphila sp. DG2A-62]MEC3998095.1 alpha/beta hydrolase [Actinacidiphila sp. DG2A-62]